MDRDPLTEQVIGCAIEVHRALGPGLLEAVYEECLCHELHENGLGFQRQIPVPVTYKAVNLETGFRADLVIEKELLIEIKAVERLLPVHQAQVLTYLKLSGIPKGLLLNFNTRVLKDGIRRFVM
ncbi:MAG: GxxExxY protein [Alphaproteobacteria bacterium]|nr:GxxExxY protein [Pseudomonadota bacterium]MCZ6467374.1 GxxExxY protein [Alphaproteobacteria bacterium]